jgi:hopene-associated glycosyltransferase HpnB
LTLLDARVQERQNGAAPEQEHDMPPVNFGSSTILFAVATLPVLIWSYLLLARGGFWRVRRQLSQQRPDSTLACSVVAVVPARNEAGVIAGAVRSLLQQKFSGTVRVIVIDDGSTDGTGNVALQAASSIGAAANLTVIAAPAPPSDWTGKVWAMSRGVLAALAMRPEYLLFTDADIVHEPENVAALVGQARARNLDLVSYMVRLSTVGFAERCLIPAFVFFFFKLYPPAWVRSRESGVAGAAGGCILIRPQALAAIGGLERIRAQIIDDCALARAVKAAGGSIWLGLTLTARSTRRYGSLREIEHMISRTAFNQLRHSYLLLAATELGLFLTYLLPPLMLLSAHAVSIALGAVALALMGVAYAPMLRFYGLSPLWGLGLPAVALFYGAATVHSAWQYCLGRGGQWKGRAQDRSTLGSKTL